MATGFIHDPENPPAEGTPAALRARIGEKFRQLPADTDATTGDASTRQPIEFFDPPKIEITSGPARTIRDTLAGRPGWDVRP